MVPSSVFYIVSLISSGLVFQMLHSRDSHSQTCVYLHLFPEAKGSSILLSFHQLDASESSRIHCTKSALISIVDNSCQIYGDLFLENVTNSQRQRSSFPKWIWRHPVFHYSGEIRLLKAHNHMKSVWHSSLLLPVQRYTTFTVLVKHFKLSK